MKELFESYQRTTFCVYNAYTKQFPVIIYFAVIHNGIDKNRPLYIKKKNCPSKSSNKVLNMLVYIV